MNSWCVGKIYGSSIKLERFRQENEKLVQVHDAWSSHKVRAVISAYSEVLLENS